jgi:hypothetical protein
VRFLCLFKSAAQAEGTPPSEGEIAAMGKFIQESVKAGKLLATEGCLPSAMGARLRLTNGAFKLTDGPFTESKEIVGGFALIQATSKQEAVEFTKTFMKISGDGEIEIRQLHEQPALAAK